jgi:diguanylate cyclase (GGDEF)-like protein
VKTGEGALKIGFAGREVHQSRTMATVLGVLLLAGATIGGLSLLLPHPSEFDVPALWSNIALAYAAAVALLLLRNRLPGWSLLVILIVGTPIVVTRAVYYGHDPSGYYTIWYLWIGVYTFFFFGLRWGLVQMAAIGAAYGWVLAELGGSTPVARGVVTIGSILVAGLLVDALAGRLRNETDASARRAANLEAVGEVARQLATQSDPRAVGWAICSAAVRTAHASAAVLWRPTHTGDGLRATAVAGADAEGTTVPFITPGSGAIQAFTSAGDRFEALRGKSAQELSPGFEAGAALWQPILRDGSTAVGVLAVYWREQLEALGGETRRAVRLLALEAAIAIERGELLGRLEVAARTDDLTGLLNRRAWDEELGRELSRADRDGAALCVAILDLDKFKLYNDTHGHQAGDRFLKQIAGAWSQTLRAGDILARYGGEEFAVALPGTNLERAEQMLERLRECVPDGQTCSAGVCRWDGSESAESLTARADTALYSAKDAGRDRIMGA